MSKRYIPYARKFFESAEWLAPRTFSEPEAWLDMVFLACYADHAIDLGKGVILPLYRGEFYYSQRFLAKRWGWSVTKVNRYLARLADGENPRIERIPRETLCETPRETNKKQGILRNKDVNNTHTSYLTLRDLFVSACMRDTHDAHEQAARTAEEMALLTQHDAEAAQEHHTRCTRCPEYNLIFWLWWKLPDLQMSFERPLTPEEAKDLLTTYQLNDVGFLIESIYNKRHTISGRSLYHTIKQWGRQDFTLKS